MSVKIARRVGVVVALAVIWWSSLGVGNARADNLGGKFERCAQLVEFVAPSATDDGHFTLLGIGPGLYNPVDDTIHHNFPFAKGVVLSDALKGQLQALASKGSFTCLRMEGDGMGLITQLAIHGPTKVCGAITRDPTGTYAIDDSDNFVHIELIGEAGKLVRSDAILGRLLVALNGDEGCLTFGLNAAGVATSIGVDASQSFCGQLLDGGRSLKVGDFLVEDADHSSGDLLPAKTIRAAALLAELEVSGCVMTQIQGSRILSAALSAEGNVCGDVAGSAETVSIDGFEIPAILGKTQTADLRAAVGGDACLDLSVADNRLTTTLKTTPLPPSPTPSLTPTPTPSPAPAATPSAAVSASPSPSPSPTPVVPAVVTADPTSGDAPPIVPLVLLVLTAGALGIVGSFLVRRYRRYRGGPVPLTAGPPDVPDRSG